MARYLTEGRQNVQGGNHLVTADSQLMPTLEAGVSRLQVLREILWNPVAKAVWTIVGVWGWFIAFQPPDVQEEVTLYKLTHNAWPWWLWAIVVLAVLLAVTFYGGMRAALDRERQLVALRTTSAPDIAELNRANLYLQNKVDALEAAQRGRRLSNTQSAEIARAIAGWREQHYPTATPEMMFIAVGHEQETIDYRDDFVAAFEAAGFDCLVKIWSAGNPECAAFRDRLTVLSEDSNDEAARFVLSVLADVGVAAHASSPHPPILQRNKKDMGTRLARKVATGKAPVGYLVVGQR